MSNIVKPQDAMAIVRSLGKPHLFITVTCNPNWPEIQRELLPGQTAADRPDLVARVFKLKLSEIKDDLFKRGVLGKPIAAIHVIEFQKRGLPHCQILMILASDSVPRGADDFDLIVSAEIPDPETHPTLYETVASCMMHGPCGAQHPNAPCMVDGKCSKGFPKAFQPETVETEGFPLYQR